MCFSATVNFGGSAVLGAAGVATLTKVKHRRELLFAAMPLLFAIHQFIDRVCVAGVGWDPFPRCGPQHGRRVHALCTGPFASVGAA
jgi:hypothetical protein